MKPLPWKRWFLVGVGCLAPLSARGALDAFLWIDGIPGEATQACHQDWIEILGVTNVVLRPASTGTSDASTTSELRLVKYVDKASPQLMLACAQGRTIPRVALDLVTTNATAIRFYEMVLSNVVVRSTSAAGISAGPEGRQQEQCSLAFRQVRWTYTEMHPRSRLPTGYLSSHWDLLESQGGSLSNLAVFKATGIQQDHNRVLLSWQGTGSRAYRIYSSPQIDGVFTPIAHVTATGDAVTSHAVTIVLPVLFFAIEEQP